MKAFRRLSIRARITIGSLIVAILFGAVAVVGVRVGVAAILANSTVTLLKHDTASFGETLQNKPGQSLGSPGESQLIAVVDPDGAVTLSTLPRSLRPRLDAILAGDESPQRVETARATYVVLNVPIETSQGTWHIVAARNADANSLVLDRLSIALIIGAVVIVIGFGFASWLLTGAALQPVNNMRREADRLAAGDSPELLSVGEARDELSALAETLNRLIQALRASADRERQLVSDASHELRTPLAVLQSELELAELDAGDPEALLADIRSSRATVLRLSTLATNLLELSRIEAAHSAGHSSWTELTNELADAADRARAYAATITTATGEPAEIDVEYAVHDASEADATEHSVELAARDIGRILDNLLGNAIAAVAGAGPRGTVTATLERHAASAVLIVADSGPGMPDAFLPVALARFTRADAARSTHAGSGLGLAIVAALVASASGSITLANAAEGGLVATITLPLG
jgi:signal transduction histidine kinase